MKKVINLKTQYSLKKTYTYNFFRTFNKLKSYSMQNSYNYLFLFKTLFFTNFKNNFFNLNIRLSNYSVHLYKYDSMLFSLSNNFSQKNCLNSRGKNYILLASNELKSNQSGTFEKLKFDKTLIKSNLTLLWHNNHSNKYLMMVNQYYLHFLL